MDHMEEISWCEQYYWQQLESHHTTVKALKERLAGQKCLIKDGTMSSQDPQYLALQAVIRQIEPEQVQPYEPEQVQPYEQQDKPWWKFW